ncbi:MAG: tetratricopeptide repeat protein [Cyanobacteriota bacterium]
MVSESLILKEESQASISYFLDLGRKSYENFVIHNKECDIDLAISSYEKALELDPYNAEAHYKLASLLWEKGYIDIETAIIKCSEAIEMEPDSVDARLHLGYFFRASGSLEEAIKQFKEAIKINFKKSAKARIALGVSLIQNSLKSTNSIKEVLTGLGHFSIGLILLPSDINSVNLILKCSKEDLQVARYKFKGKILEGLGLSISAFRTYCDATEKLNKKEVFYELLGDIQKSRQNFVIAADYYRKAINLNPTNKKIYEKILSVLDEELDAREIINYHKVLIEFEPENHKLYYELGQLYLEDKNYFGAIDSFRKALNLQPDNAFYHNCMAYNLVQVDDYDGAINEYQRAISLCPDNTWTAIVCQALGAIYYQAKRNPEAAIMSYQMAINLDPQNAEALIAVAEIHYDKGNLDSAIYCYEKALEIDNNNPQANCNLGFVYWEKNEVDKAISYYQKAISLYKEYDIAYNNLGVAYLDGLSKAKLALKIFELAIKYNPNYALAYYNKARCLEELNKKPAAADYYQMALDINTFTKELNPDEIQKRLDKLFKV